MMVVQYGWMPRMTSALLIVAMMSVPTSTLGKLPRPPVSGIPDRATAVNAANSRLTDADGVA